MYSILIYAFFKLIHLFVQQFINSIGETILTIFEYGIYIILCFVAIYALGFVHLSDMYDSRWSNEVAYQYKLFKCMGHLGISFEIYILFEILSIFIISVYYYIQIIPWYSRYTINLLLVLNEIFYGAYVFIVFQPYTYSQLFNLNKFILRNQINSSEDSVFIKTNPPKELNGIIEKHSLKIKTQ